MDTAKTIFWKKMSYATPASRRRETQQMNHHRQPRPYRQHKRYNENRCNNNNFRRKQRRPFPKLTRERVEIERVEKRLMQLSEVVGAVVGDVCRLTEYVDNQFNMRPIMGYPPPYWTGLAIGARGTKARGGRGSRWAPQPPCSPPQPLRNER